MSTLPNLALDIRLQLDRFELDVAMETTRRATGIFGVSGSGKSSLIEAIAGLRRGVRGRISMDGETWLDSERGIRLPPEKRGVGYVPQDGLLLPHLTVLENLRFGTHGSAGTDPLAHVIRILEIESLLRSRPGTLSGGERQRVALGRALCSGARLLLLDEPLAPLDIGLRHRLLPFLQRVQEEFATPMLLVSHNPVEVQALCEDLVVLREGRIIARGEPRQVLIRPEVFPMAEREGFENILPARVAGERSGASLLKLGDSGEGPEIVAPRIEAIVGTPVLASIPARDIILATTRPTGLSARNIIPTRIREIQEIGELRLISLELHAGIPPVIVEITPDALEELRLTIGIEVFLIVKAHTIAVHSLRGRGDEGNV